MASNAFPPLANVQIPAQSRAISTSCCPDKDLVLLISRLGGLDRISLWNSNQGTKVWETDVGDEDATVNVDGIAWSPDGQSIACMLNPPRVTLHSIQDGRVISSLPLEVPLGQDDLRLAGIWWFQSSVKGPKNTAIPDIFRRNGIIVGSAEAVLKNLPYLDSLQEDSDKFTATNLFAFQGSQTRVHSKSQLPEAISSWPTLSPDSKVSAVDSSIQHQSSTRPTETLDEKDESNLNSVLMISDTLGNVYSFLDGAFPLGVISLGREASLSAVEKTLNDPKFLGHAKFNSVSASKMHISPTIIDVPLLASRKTRDLARLSSIVRDLTWYIVRVAREMKEAWVGSESTTGARELGPRWVEALHAKQRNFGKVSADPILDLTWLLTTGRASEALADFIGSGEQMSERGIQKWEQTMSDALIKLRDHSDKRLAQAFQRVHVVLQELQGWQQLPQFSIFNLDFKELQEAADAVARGTVLVSWLSATVRRELYRFKEFIAWLRYECANNSSSTEPNPSRHDILEVNNYFVSGLTTSVLDLWFEGEIPRFSPRDLGVPEPDNGPLDAVIQRARSCSMSYDDMEWQENIEQNDHSSIKRNIVALTDDLAARCSNIFAHAAGAASRSAIVHHLEQPISPTESNTNLISTFRERIVLNVSNEFLHNYLALVKDHSLLVLVQSSYGDAGLGVTLKVAVLSLQCGVDPSKVLPASVIAAEYFDDETIAVVYRVNNRDGIHSEMETAFLSTFDYSGLEYLDAPYNRGMGANFEELVTSAVDEWKIGNIGSIPIVVTRRRGLNGGKHGECDLAVNGRKNRRVVCVVDGIGSRLESFDLGDEGEEMDEE
ncbi:hypothetical protein FA15DRAFT_676805 [Coprinopsis marcescibilis]|uniref:Anaphase-promoting complex subunit 4 n=1 Tax=Coprinopsis marcescibilis TaxID=230819 RepID=A0A5C3LP14_COPMA|nr:hypothetical protein FA15DRAFT_676805 [Coprinopsis marcescibilis]